MFQTGVKKSFKFVRLSPSEVVNKFDCGDADLNDFILNRASDFQKYLLTVNYACVDIDDASKVYAYCSLANDKVATADFKDKTGCRFLTVDAYLDAVPFYEKNGFHRMNAEDNDPHTRLMYYDLMDIAG